MNRLGQYIVGLFAMIGAFGVIIGPIIVARNRADDPAVFEVRATLPTDGSPVLISPPKPSDNVRVVRVTWGTIYVDADLRVSAIDGPIDIVLDRNGREERFCLLVGERLVPAAGGFAIGKAEP